MSAPSDVPVVTLPSGDRMPMVGFGTWKLRADQARASVVAALHTGYRHIDTATMYANERAVGQALRDSGFDRSEIFVTTKIRPSDAGQAAAILASSLEQLGTDYLDLWLIHWPPPRKGASRMLWNELLEVQAGGQVRNVGVSNYSLTEIDDLTRTSRQAPAVNQIDWGPTLYDGRILAGHAERGIAVEGYSGLKNTNLDEPVLAKIATVHGVTSAQVVLRWHLEHAITVIPKSSKPERIATNFDLQSFALSPDEVASIDALAS
jgi:2,5-diketo-D-gluconate reductase A